MNYSKFLSQLKEEFKNDDSVSSKIAEYIMNNINDIVNISLEEIATNAYTTTPSVVKFLKKFGFVGLKDFKITLAYEIAQYKKANLSENNDSYLGSIQENLIQLGNQLGSISRLAEDVNKSKSIYLVGYGKNKLIIDYFVSNTFWVGKNFTHFVQKEVEFIHKYRKTDALFILVSFTGQTSEIKKIADILEEDKSNFWVITSNPNHNLLPKELKNNEIILGSNESAYLDSWSFEISLLTTLNLLTKKLSCEL